MKELHRFFTVTKVETGDGESVPCKPVISGSDETKLEKSKQMSKRIFAKDATEILISNNDIIALKDNGERVSTGATAFSHEELGDWVTLDLMEYETGVAGTSAYCSVVVTPEHAREYALAILRELEAYEYK